MKYLIFVFICYLAILLQPIQARNLEIEVYGMTCAFCVDSLQRAFRKDMSVRKVEVSLELKKVRLETNGDLPSNEVIRQTIFDAGFTPIKITELPVAVD